MRLTLCLFSIIIIAVIQSNEILANKELSKGSEIQGSLLPSEAQIKNSKSNERRLRIDRHYRRIRRSSVTKKSREKSLNDVGRSSSGEVKDAEPREEDLIEAADFGVEAMNDLYSVKEPKLYKMGLYLKDNNPARFVAAFNALTDEAKELTRFGYAALEATKKFRSKFPSSLRQTLISQTGQSMLSQQCPKKGTPQCPPASMWYRTTDGSCNNRQHLWWGSSMSSFLRFIPAVYEDGIDSIRRSVTGRLLPSARQISDYLHEERDAPLVSVSHMLMQWGQFVDHDLTATAQSRAFQNSVPQCCLNLGTGFQPPELMHPDCMPIVVDPQDTHLSQFDVRCMEFVRSGPAPGEDCEFGAREQLNQVTSFLDASAVYSSSARQGDTLRIFRNGMMQYGKMESQRPLLPRRHDDSDLCRRGALSTSCFKAGDGRLSEQPALISLHVVFLRLHNRFATQLASLNPHWSDEKIYQESRKIVGAIVQHITYREFLPIVLGNEVTKIFGLQLLEEGYYKGYDPTVNPSIANGFATAAFRFGHSLVQQSFVRFDKNHRPISNNVTIHEEFSNPANLESAGSVDRILLGLVNQPAQKRDVFISEELTNHLFQTPGFQFGMDLASINIQRGRDHGIPPFVNWRQPCVLSPIRNWDDLERVTSPEAARKFRDLYDAVEDIDLFSGGLAEKPVVGGLVGPTFACIIAQQFNHLRRGDRFWYENPFPDAGFSSAQLERIRRVTLAQILCRTMDSVDSIQPFVMLISDDLRNRRVSCDSFDQLDLSPWVDKPPRQRDRFGELHSVIEEIVKVKPISREPKARNSQKVKSSHSRVGPRPHSHKPIKTKINQHNRIVVQRPLGPAENLTIVVNNHAVNSPVFVTDSIYGSNYYVNPYEHSQGRPGYHQPSRPPLPNNNYYDQRPPAMPSPTYLPPMTSTHRPPYDNQPPPTSPFNPYNNHQDPDNPNPTYDSDSRPKPPRPPVYGSDFDSNPPQPPLYGSHFRPNNPYNNYPTGELSTQNPYSFRSPNEQYDFESSPSNPRPPSHSVPGAPPSSTIAPTTKKPHSKPRPSGVNSHQKQQSNTKNKISTRPSNRSNVNGTTSQVKNKNSAPSKSHSDGKDQVLQLLKKPEQNNSEEFRSELRTDTENNKSVDDFENSKEISKVKNETSLSTFSQEKNTRDSIESHEDQSPNYLYTHSTTSDVKYVSTEKPEDVQNQTSKSSSEQQAYNNQTTLSDTVDESSKSKEGINLTTSVNDETSGAESSAQLSNSEKKTSTLFSPLLKISLDNTASEEPVATSNASDELPRPIIFKNSQSDK